MSLTSLRSKSPGASIAELKKAFPSDPELFSATYYVTPAMEAERQLSGDTSPAREALGGYIETTTRRAVRLMCQSVVELGSDAPVDDLLAHARSAMEPLEDGHLRVGFAYATAASAGMLPRLVSEEDYEALYGSTTSDEQQAVSQPGEVLYAA